MPNHEICFSYLRVTLKKMVLEIRLISTMKDHLSKKDLLKLDNILSKKKLKF